MRRPEAGVGETFHRAGQIHFGVSASGAIVSPNRFSRRISLAPGADLDVEIGAIARERRRVGADRGAARRRLAVRAQLVGSAATQISMDHIMEELLSLVAERNPDFYELYDGSLRPVT
ncbi:MAG TPA: hypothetical protein VK446_12085 [Methylocystis sp.]|nr:hypothetical protein [Methylocystis sp.]